MVATSKRSKNSWVFIKKIYWHQLIIQWFWICILVATWLKHIVYPYHFLFQILYTWIICSSWFHSYVNKAVYVKTLKPKDCNHGSSDASIIEDKYHNGISTSCMTKAFVGNIRVWLYARQLTSCKLISAYLAKLY